MAGREIPEAQPARRACSLHLSARLDAIASMVTPGNTVADVGCDHGYIPIRLCGEDIAPAAIASDINRGPLRRVEENIRQYHLEEKISLRLSDGLENYMPGEADTLIIAGMGGILIAEILEKKPAVRDSFREIILGPQSEYESLRNYLGQRGITIAGEDLISEDGKYYPVLRCIPGGEPYALIETEARFGPCLFAARHPVLKEQLAEIQEKTEELLEKLMASDSLKAKRRTEELKEEMLLIKAALAYYEM